MQVNNVNHEVVDNFLKAFPATNVGIKGILKNSNFPAFVAYGKNWAALLVTNDEREAIQMATQFIQSNDLPLYSMGSISGFAYLGYAAKSTVDKPFVAGAVAFPNLDEIKHDGLGLSKLFKGGKEPVIQATDRIVALMDKGMDTCNEDISVLDGDGNEDGEL